MAKWKESVIWSETNKDESNKVPIDGNEVVLHLAGTRFDHCNDSARGPFQRACPAVACKGDYASAVLAWIGVWLEDPEPTLLNWEALHILRDQAYLHYAFYVGIFITKPLKDESLNFLRFRNVHVYLLILLQIKDRSTSSMAGGSISDPCIIDDDDPYFPPLTNPYIIVDDYSIPDEKYAEQLQLHEALVFSSASRASTSSSPKTPIVILDNQDLRALTSSSPNTPIVILDGQDSQAYESSQVADRFCDICMDIKTESEMFRNTKVCGHMFCFDCIRGHVAAKIQENITKVRCPDPNCRGIIGPEVCRLIVPKEVLERWEDALCELSPGILVSCRRGRKRMDKLQRVSNIKKDERDPSDLMLRDLAKNKAWKRCGHQFCYGCGKYHPDHRWHKCPKIDGTSVSRKTKKLARTTPKIKPLNQGFKWNNKDTSTSNRYDYSLSSFGTSDDDNEADYPNIRPFIGYKYAEQLQLEEALEFSSASLPSRASTSSSSKLPIDSR
ncbi:zinc finger, C6HC-type containing protein, partial [Tanacetum coccineum]